MASAAASSARPLRETNTDFEVRSLDAAYTETPSSPRPWWRQIKYFVAGIGFGLVLVKAEIVSWWRIQEMFRLESFHMYGVIGSAVVTGIISVALIKKFGVKALDGAPIRFYPKQHNKGQVIGGLLFGCGWAITGACPGPLFAQIGAGFTVVIITLLSAIAGTWVYGYFRERLPH